VATDWLVRVRPARELGSPADLLIEGPGSYRHPRGVLPREGFGRLGGSDMKHVIVPAVRPRPYRTGGNFWS
jgi:hypothetical protein